MSKWRVEVHTSCGWHEAYIYEGNAEHSSGKSESGDFSDYPYSTDNESPEEHYEKVQAWEWTHQLKVLTEALRKMVEEGKMTQEEADLLLAEWLRDHPDPSQDTEPIPVEMPIPIKLPAKKESVERS